MLPGVSGCLDIEIADLSFPMTFEGCDIDCIIESFETSVYRIVFSEISIGYNFWNLKNIEFYLFNAHIYFYSDYVCLQIFTTENSTIKTSILSCPITVM